MKKILVLAVLLLSLTVSAQGFNRWSVAGDFGAHAVGDESADLRDNYNHFGGNLRYNINPRFGLGITYGKDNLSLVNFDGGNINTEYNRYNLEAFVDIFDVLELQNNFVTILGHGGGGISTIDADETDFYQSVFNMRGGLTVLFKLSRTLALSLDAATTVNISQDRTLDGYYDISNAGINSTVDNASVGLIVYLGKKGKDGKKRQHADWARPVKKIDTVYLQPTIIDKTVTNNNTDVVEVEKSQVEYVAFENDSYEISTAGINAIKKSADKVEVRGTIRVVGYASPPASDEYNKKLSQNRALAVANFLKSEGVTRVEVEYRGEINTTDGKNVGLSRVVAIIIEKD